MMAPQGLSRDMGFGSIFGGNIQYGDYDHCINALRSLQKRVTVCLIYDPKKQQMKKGKSPAKVKPAPKDPLQDFYIDSSKNQDENQVHPPDLDSQMED